MALPLRYHAGHLLAHRTTTVLTILVIAAVVGVFCWMLGFRLALTRSLSVAGDDRKLIVMKPGATAESNSAIRREEFNRLTSPADVETGADGQVLISPEMLVQVSLPRIRDGGATFANIAVRGVRQVAFAVHRNVRPSGPLELGDREVIVGRAAAKQFAGLEIGSTIGLGYGADRVYTVVGHFSAGGGPAESEIWGDLDSLMNAYNRRTYSSVNLRLAPGADVDAVIEQIEGPAIQLHAVTEAEYWDEQARMIKAYVGLAGGLIAVMALAAVFSIANTLYATVAGRTREIAMLRTIGYTGGHILWGFVIESVLLSIVGGILGCLGCRAWLSMVGNTKDMFGMNTFTTLAFEIRMSWEIVVGSLLLVVAVGVLGALMPARRAARLDVMTALRDP